MLCKPFTFFYFRLQLYNGKITTEASFVHTDLPKFLIGA